MSTPQTISELKAASYNPRQIKAENFQRLTYSIHEFGDLSGITFNLSTGNLVTGHQRVESLKQQYGDALTITDKGICLSPSNYFHVRFVEWTLEKEMAANIAANHTGLQGEFTVDVQQILLDLEKVMADDYAGLGLGTLENEDALFANVGYELDGFDPNKQSEDLGGKYQEAIKYIVVFDTLEQKHVFETFIENTRKRFTDEPTIAAALTAYLQQIELSNVEEL